MMSSKEEEEEDQEEACGSLTTSKGNDGEVDAMELLDDYWFFKNTLNIARKTTTLRRTPPSSIKEKDNKESGIKEKDEKESGPVIDLLVPSTPKFSGGGVEVRTSTPALERRPSLPPRLRREAATEATAAVQLLLRSRNPKQLRYSFSSLDSRGSSSPFKFAQSKTSSTPRTTRYGLENGRELQLEKKWKSLTDLEVIEVQGFKDLGFVFDKEGVNASLVKVIPGLGTTDEEMSRRRPYLSEAWLHVHPVVRWVDKRSAENMKDQLRFWARAVASNVRQEC